VVGLGSGNCYLVDVTVGTIRDSWAPSEDQMIIGVGETGFGQEVGLPI
jgi:hypothetical protein